MGDQLQALGYLSLLLLAYLIGNFIAWKKIWFDPFGAELPIDKSINIQEMNKRRLYAKTKTFSIFKRMFLSIVYKLEMEYWVLHCGTDGYLYLLFQRQMLKLSFSLSIVMFVFSAIMNLVADGQQMVSTDTDEAKMALAEKITLSNREFSGNRSWFHVLMVAVITFLTIRMLRQTRHLARKAYELQSSWQTKSKDQEQLKFHTVHIKGIPAEDRTGNGLRILLERFLAPRGGSPIAIQIVPPFHKMIEIETKTRDLKYVQMMTMSAEQPFFCCVPSKYLEETRFEEKLEKLEEKLIDQTLKPFEPSGHAFVCLDSVGSVKACEKEFKVTASDYVKFSCQVLASNITSCFGCFGKSQSRDRSKSTAFKHSGQDLEDDEELTRLYKDSILIARPATEPADILWKNMRGNRGLFLMRRLALFILGILIIIFVSSPAVLFSNIRAIDKSHFWDFEWVEDLPEGNILKNHAAPLIIILINLLLLLIIDFMCIVEAYETHSLYQEAVLTKSFIYLILNMLVIPALTLNGQQANVQEQNKALAESGDSLWSFISTRGFSISQLLSEIYMGENGIFFVSLILQTGVYTSTYYMLQTSDLMFSYFSPWLANMRRKVYQDYEPWLRQEQNNFYYGYFYAQTLTVFAIFIFFSATVPLITVATAFFCLLRHTVDCFNLLNVNRKEIDSQGDLIEVATNTGFFLIVSYQICMMAFFSMKDLQAEAFFCTFLFICSIFTIVLTYKYVNDVDSGDKDCRQWLEEVQENDSQYQAILNNWRAEYDHPCVVSKSRRKVATTMNDVFQEVNDWDAFANDSRIQGLLDPSDYPKNSAMYKINQSLAAMSPEQQKKVKKANLALALASHNQSFAQVADLFAGQLNPLSDGGDSKRAAKQRLLNEDAPRSSSAVLERGSSLFIRRVADLEQSDRKDSGQHFKDSSGKNIEMSDSSPFRQEQKEESKKDDLAEIVEEIKQ